MTADRAVSDSTRRTIRIPRPVQLLGAVVTSASLVSELIATPSDSPMERVTMGLLHLGLLGVFVQPVVGGIVVIAAATLAWVLDASTSGRPSW